MSEQAPDVIYLEVELSVEEYDLEVETGDSYDMELETELVVYEVSGDEYEGPYTVTPTQSTQTLSTAFKTCVNNIVVNPIPSNYGLITWNGSVLTVS